MTVSGLFWMGAIAILLLGTFNGFLAQTLPLRLPIDTRLLAWARLQYLFWGIGIFVVGAVAHLHSGTEERRLERCSKLGFWLMFLGFNLAFFPTTLRRSQALVTDPMRWVAAAVGPEVLLGVFMFISGMGLCVWSYTLVARSTN
jgi:hypothetical protein